MDDCIGEKVEKTAGAAPAGRRFAAGKAPVITTQGKRPTSRATAEKLAKVADAYVNDAFGAAHRAHASTEGVARVIAKRGGQCAAGLLERELKFWGRRWKIQRGPSW